MDNSKTIGISVAVFVACSTINAVMSQKPKETSTVVKPHGAAAQVGCFANIELRSSCSICRQHNVCGSELPPLECRTEWSRWRDVKPTFPFLILWSACLAYFFGFFGISLVDTDALGSSPSSFGLAELQRQADASAAAVTAERKRAAAVLAASSNASATTSVAPSSATTCAPHVDEDEVDYTLLSDEEVLGRLLDGKLKDYQLEKRLGDYERAVALRRMLYENILDKGESSLGLIPFKGYDYDKVFGANCEIVVGYVPLPLVSWAL